MNKEVNVLLIAENQLRKIIREELKNGTKPTPDHEFVERMNRKQTARFLGITYQTVYHWKKKGIIKEHGCGRKRYFLKSELIEAMENQQ